MKTNHHEVEQESGARKGVKLIVATAVLLSLGWLFMSIMQKSMQEQRALLGTNQPPATVAEVQPESAVVEVPATNVVTTAVAVAPTNKVRSISFNIKPQLGRNPLVESIPGGSQQTKAATIN